MNSPLSHKENYFNLMLNYELVDSREKLNSFTKKLARQRAFVLNTETTGLDPFAIELLGVSFCFEDGKAYYVPCLKSEILNLKSVLENLKIEKFGHNLKYDIEVLRENGINLSGVAFDTMIASYLLNPGTRAHDLDFLVTTELKKKIMPLEALMGKGKTKIPLGQIPVQNFARYSCERAEATWRLTQKLKLELQKANLSKLFSKIEMPLVPVLAGMEAAGIQIDSNLLKKYSSRVQKQLSKISEQIFKMAKTKFNLDSPIQLRQIIFEKLKIKTDGLGWGKTGISTAAGELLKLRGAHPIIDLILEYRELTKLRSTYLLALPKLINPKTGRVHTSFNQTITATGRLSSSNPNLQNIPTRGDLGKIVRIAFVAPPGTKLISVDYAHIELRIIASLANDKKMIEAFQAGEDIHTETACKIWGIKPKEVTPEIRRAAKTINFGVTYGMGARGLAESAGIPLDEAHKFIKKYFEIYQGIKNFLEKTKFSAKKFGYVETLFGRRRYLPEIDSPIRQFQAQAERMAINMPVQGTAADVIKLAMIKIAQNLSKISPSSKMILQVHDELVFEVQEKEIRKVAKFVKEAMENVVKLRVPIVADVEVGLNWGEMEKYKV